MKKESLRMSRKIAVGNKFIGGGSRITVQSMLSKRSDDFEGNISQAVELEKAGCDIIRVAIPDMPSVKLIEKLKENVSVPSVADIHFDGRLAIESANAGVDKIRINPGNIGSDDRIKAVADHCRTHGVPIRVGVNSGSLDKELLGKYGSPTPEALAESALKSIETLQRFDFEDIVVAIKSSDVKNMVQACRVLSQQTDCPLHLGVTEAGGERMGMLKSAVGIGSLLLDGIGDTIRVSLTADPVLEVKAGLDILKAIGLGTGATIVSCPTCGRTRIGLIPLAERVEKAVADIRMPIKVAVMGCAVNGPGEAREADIGIAGGDGCAVLFKKGTIVKKASEEEIFDILMQEIREMNDAWERQK